MHSRIYNISKEPISEDELYDKLIRQNGLMDYVSLQDKTEMAEDIDWISNCYGFEHTDTSFTITRENAQAYWDKTFEVVNNLIKDKGLTIETRYDIIDRLDDKYGMYLITNDHSVIPVCDAFSYILENITSPGEFEVLETFDYHW